NRLPTPAKAIANPILAEHVGQNFRVNDGTPLCEREIAG
ncbi:MAG: hypothetical protein QOJ63_1601, partial [Solirubrobacteraceae bacterium]|nr:hypothetical protein [Solirubrobacteraceae bacterium]